MTEDNPSPVQAGTDPLVAEIEARLQNLDARVGSPIALEAAALLRSQAERIAVLEEAATAKDIEHRAQLCDMSERFRAVNIQRVIEASGADILAMRDRVEAAEALLAEAREALAYSAMGLRRIHDALVRPGPKQAVGEMVEHFMTKADATLSRLKPGEKGGGGAVEAGTPGAPEAFAALDVADRIIERAFGTEVPGDWHEAYRAVAKARNRKSRRALPAAPTEGEG